MCGAAQCNGTWWTPGFGCGGSSTFCSP
jgi:hypothetical protein